MVFSIAIVPYDSANPNAVTFERYSTVTSRSVNRMSEFVKFLGIDSKTKNIHFEPVFVCGRCLYNKLDAPEPKEFIQVFRETLKIAKNFNVNIFYSGARLYALHRYSARQQAVAFVLPPKEM